jgi:E3 ubiquitin-protein ligase UHRF1
LTKHAKCSFSPQNKELLESLGLDKPLVEPKEQKRKPSTTSKKRKSTATNDEAEEPSQPATKSQCIEIATNPDSTVRRSSRNTGKHVDYRSEIRGDQVLPLAFSSGVKISENEGPLGRDDGVRKHDPFVQLVDVEKTTHLPLKQENLWFHPRSRSRNVVGNSKGL